jgi:hypothetical protein
MNPRTIELLAWWVASRKWIVGAGIAALVLRLVMAGFVHHAKVQERDRFTPTPTVNVLLDQKSLKECWAGEVEHRMPKEVEQALLEAVQGLERTKYGTPEADAAYKKYEQAYERWKYYADHPEQGSKVLVRNLPYCSDLREGSAQ